MRPNWLKRLFSLRPSPVTTIRRPRLAIEPLENRITPAYSATLAASTSTWLGNSTTVADTVIFNVDTDTGNLVHNRFLAGDPGFNSALDFDSVQAGDQVLAANVASVINLTTGAAADQIQMGSAFGAFNSPARSLLAEFNISNGNSAGKIVLINDSAATTGQTYTVSDTVSTTSVTGLGINVDLAGNVQFASTTLSTSTAADTISITATNQANPVSVNSGAGNDVFLFANNGRLGGAVDGGADTDTLDYSNYTTTQVDVNLGLGTSGMSGTLDASQPVTPTTSTATGTVTVSNYNVLTKEFDISLTVTNLNPADVTALTMNRESVGVDGPIINDLMPIFGPLTPAGTGFTATANGLNLLLALAGGVANEAALLGGLTYINIATAAFPAGAIRGQIFSNANTNVATGTAFGTTQVSNIENATGGGAADSLVGSFQINTLNGNGGDDIILGAPGNDILNGGAADDTIAWSNGDGSDTMDGGPGTSDVVQVNGNVTQDDTFTVNANGARVDFDRTNLGTFSLDIGTVESLTVNGIGGADQFSIGNLTGVTDLESVLLSGFDGNDVFNVVPTSTAGRDYLIHGNLPTTAAGDTLNIDLTGGTTGMNVVVAQTNGASRTGQINFANRRSVFFQNVETLPITSPTVFAVGAGFGDQAQVKVLNTTNHATLLQFTAFTNFQGSVVTAIGDVTGDGVIDVIVGAESPHQGGHVKVFNGQTGAELRSFFAFPGFSGGIQVGGSDVNNDGAVDIIVGAGPGAQGGHVKAFDGKTNAEIRSFLAYPGYIGGVTVAGGDFNNDGIGDIVTGTGVGVPGHVKVFNGQNVAVLQSFFAFDPGYVTGITVGSGRFDAVAGDDIVVGSRAGGAVRTISGLTPGITANGTATPLKSFFAYPGFTGGINVSGTDRNGDGRDEILTGVGLGVPPHVKVFDSLTLAELDSFFAFDQAFLGGVSVGG